jgi:hypothetical protein
MQLGRLVTILLTFTLAATALNLSLRYPIMGLAHYLLWVIQIAATAAATSSSVTFPGSASVYTVPTAFPTSVYSSYYGKMTITSIRRVQLTHI